MKINWSDGTSKVSPHFSVHEALWLPTWGRLATEADGLTLEIKANLILLFDRMEVVREFVGKAINVHVTYRPKLYNKEIKGATNSAHIYGKAIDFDVAGMTCDAVRKLIVPKLVAWDMRCEHLDGTNWVHLDTKSVGSSGTRYFIPK